MSYRLRHWDYSNNAPYFITICTQNRKHFFGEISDGKMHLSDIGKIVENEWIKTPNIRPEMQLELGEFVVMPNHFHAILIISNEPWGRQAWRHTKTNSVPNLTTWHLSSADLNPQLQHR